MLPLYFSSQDIDVRLTRYLPSIPLWWPLWDVRLRARHFAFGIVILASLFVALWVDIGNGIHKNLVAPTPVHISDLFIATSYH